MRCLWAVSLLASVLTAAGAAPPAPQNRPWRLAIAGGYGTGYQGLMALHGLPRVRIDDSDIVDVAALRQYDVVITCVRNAASEAAMRALEQFAREGGIVITELGPPPSAEAIPGQRVGPAISGNSRFVASGHPISQGLPELGLISTQGLTVTAIVPPANSPAVVLSRFTDESVAAKHQGNFRLPGGQYAPAIIMMPLGKGHLLYSPTYLSFDLALRGRTFEPLICNVLEVLSQGQLRDRMNPVPLERNQLVTLRTPNPEEPVYPAFAGTAQPAPQGLEVLEEAGALRDFVLTGTLPASGDARVLVGHWSDKENEELLFTGSTLTLTSRHGGQTTPRSLKLPHPGKSIILQRRAGLLTLRNGGAPVLSWTAGWPRQGLLAAKGLGQPSYQPLSSVTFDDDFMRESGFSGDWEAQSGKWQVVASEGKPEMGANPFDYQIKTESPAVTLTGNWFWSDYEVGVSVKFAGQAVGLLATYQSPTDYLLLRLSPLPEEPRQARLQLVRRGGTTDKVLAETKVEAGPEDWQRLQMRSSRGRVHGLLNGELLLRATDDPAASGRIGLYCDKGAASFDDVQVQPWTASRPANVPSPTEFIRGSGKWLTAEKGAVLAGVDRDGARCYLPWPAVTDARATVRVKLGQAEAAGLLARADERNFVLVTLVRGGGQLRLRAFRQGKPGVLLAEKPVAGRATDWRSLAVTCHGSRLQASLDGRPTLDLLDTGARPGTFGLYARGAQPAYFQSLEAWQEEAPDRLVDELTPAFAGIIDRHTWAGRSGAWTPDPTQLNCFWHQGYFPGEVRCAVGIHPGSEAETTTQLHLTRTGQPVGGYTLLCQRDWSQDTVRLKLLRQGKAVATVTAGVPVRRAYAVSLERRGGSLAVTVNDHSALAYRDASPLPGLDSLGLDNGGQLLQAEDIEVSSPQVHDYTFESAPTDWTVQSGTWKVSSRWSCTPGWAWFAGYDSAGLAQIASRRSFQGDLDVTTYVGAKMMPAGNNRFSEKLTDVRLGICADPGNANSGYQFVLGGNDNTWSGLLRHGKLVTTSPYRLGQAGIHNDWLRLTLRRRGNRIELWGWDARLMEWQDPEPLAGGRVTLGTQRNGVLIPRVTIYGQRQLSD